ncbi:Adenylate/guanylate cyclase [Desulfosporosinus sp. I2]|uniref:sensor domain-containing diguanylate cyclase/phosphohydrolase n=1 Tax=Desulfosporosinus sp. I2 TaxID=1617025 RepID=UPI0005EF0697|nr:HD domain-containing phosphohydrolase [Desulfosporosinus sp. I2]KJR49075.1 Adenylate/guanylate cyclase [Desulfosporosinus sp. I2]
MRISFKNLALLLLLLFLVLFFPKPALASYDPNAFKLLSELLITFTVAVTLHILNTSKEKKLICMTAELAETRLKLKESDDKIKTLLVNLNVGVALFSPKGEFLLCNRKFIELGSPKNLADKGEPLVEQSLKKQSLIEHLPKVSLEEVIIHYINEDGQSLTMDEFPLFKVLSTGKPSREQVIGIKNPDNGSVRWAMGDHEPEFDEAGELSKVLVTIVDITDRKNSEKALKESENRLSAFLKVMPDMFFLLDRNGYLIDNYIENTIIPSHMQSDFLGKNIKNLDFVDEYIAELTFQNIEKLFGTGEIQTFEFCSQKLGQETFFEARLVLCGDDKVLAVVRDISQRKVSEVKLYNMSIHDTPTNLYNRNYFEQALDKYLDKNTSGMGIVICDIDGLKLVNDTLGHAVGDDYLKTAATILCQCFDCNDVVARIGGDEFAVLIKHTTTKELSAISSEIDRLLAMINTEERIIPISMSLGYAVGDGTQKDLKELLKIADNLMYREKLHHRQSEKSKNIDILTKMLEVRDFITEGHGDRMQELSGKLAEAIGMSNNDIKDMHLFAQFHDIGKVGIPDRILFKPGRLTDEEMNEMKLHTEIGYRIAESSPDLIHISDWILKHHEWWDGNGYPFKLKGEEIPVQSRILSIVDAFDAMTNNRPYRKALSKEEALLEIVKFKGTQFDPKLVDKFVELS